MDVLASDRSAAAVIPLAVILGALATGCANQNSIFRVADTDANKTETILIDAKQRPITVNTNKDKQKLCLARSADALSQAAASGNLKVTQASGGSGELGFSDIEQVTSIAFRTQVTEAQQEFLFYLCQLNSNGVLSDGDVSDNLKHFQNTMLAMVAIDDLAAVGKASAPTTKKAADKTSTDADSAKTKAAQSKVDDAQKAQDKGRGTVDSELAKLWAANGPKDADKLATQFSADLKTYDGDFAKYLAALEDLQKIIKTSKGDTATEPANVIMASTALTTAGKTVTTEYGKESKLLAALIKEQDPSKFKTAQDAAINGYYNYRKATDAAAAKAEAFSDALTAWLKAKEDPKDTQNAKDSPGSDSSIAPSGAVAQAVTTIVQTIVWQSFVGEKCQTALFTNFSATNDKVLDFCFKHLQDADAYRFLALQTGAVKPDVPIQPLSEEVEQLKEMMQLAEQPQ